MSETDRRERLSNEVEKPQIYDPRKYFDLFRESGLYREAYDSFFQGKTPSRDVSPDELAEVFESSYPCKSAFLNFSKEVPFRYSPSLGHYPETCVCSIGEYLKTLQDVRRDTGAVVALDVVRSSCHVAAGRELVECGIAPSMKLAKALLSVIAISKNLETYAVASVSDADRLERVSKFGQSVY